MRAYVTILDGDDALLPFFVRHYRRLGATSFPLLSYGSWSQAHRAIETLEALGAAWGLLTRYPSAKFSARHREAVIATHHRPGEWAFFCDLDEFAELSASDVEWVVSGRAELPYVGGRWIDRVATGGKLAAVSPTQDLEAQFPLAGQLRPRWGMGDAAYVLSPFAPQSHHPNACAWGKRAWPDVDRQAVRVHHFKWQTNIVVRLRRRLARIDAVGKSRTPWAARVQKMLEHLETHQGIDPALLTPVGSVLGI